MPLKLYSTLTRKKSIFKPIKPGFVSMYSCGLTVYNYGHIGNFRAFINADILKRYLEYGGFNVKHVTNITDVDDKTIRESQKEKISLKEFTEKYTKAFFDNCATLNIEPSNYYPKATGYIQEMVEIIKLLLEKQYAYKSEDGSIYFKISKFKNYGKLARLEKQELKAGARVDNDEYGKDQANDFVLWKAYSKEDGDNFWLAETGKGRPGWHLECSAMSTKHLGQPFDIHTGGIDLVFPHHQNEIAQSEAAFGKKFVNYWFHNEYLLVEGKKMSKSFGNFYTLRDLLIKGYSGRQIRYLLLSTHYRQPLNFTFQGLDAAKNSLQRIDDFMLSLKIYSGGKDAIKIKNLIKKTKLSFEKAMDDDLNISLALSYIFNLIKQANISISKKHISRKTADELISLMHNFDKVLGVLKEGEKIPKEIEELVRKREHARKIKDFLESDKLRNLIKQKGYIVEDTLEGPKVKKYV